MHRDAEDCQRLPFMTQFSKWGCLLLYECSCTNAVEAAPTFTNMLPEGCITLLLANHSLPRLAARLPLQLSSNACIIGMQHLGKRIGLLLRGCRSAQRLVQSQRATSEKGPIDSCFYKMSVV